MASSEYSPESFYCGATDTKGHSRVMRVHPDAHGPVSILVSDDRLPYKTFDDFVRDAVAHRWRWVAEHLNDPFIMEQADLLIEISRLENQKKQVARERHLVDELRTAIADPAASHYLTAEQLNSSLRSVKTPSLNNELTAIISQWQQSHNG